MPVMPLEEVVGSAVKIPPVHIGATCANNGTVGAFTVMVIVAVVAHTPPFGVKVYVVVAVLFSAGDHVPVIPFRDVVGNAANVPPEQIAATGAKAGVTFGVIVIVNVTVVAHCPAVGVKV